MKIRSMMVAVAAGFSFSAITLADEAGVAARDEFGPAEVEVIEEDNVTRSAAEGYNRERIRGDLQAEEPERFEAEEEYEAEGGWLRIDPAEEAVFEESSEISPLEEE